MSQILHTMYIFTVIINLIKVYFFLIFFFILFLLEYRPFTPPPPRERLSYTRYQLELLNGIYAKVRYPNSSQKQLIAKRVGITREQVKVSSFSFIVPKMIIVEMNT
jgi:hypothetical protein